MSAFGGEGGHRTDMAFCLLMSQSGHANSEAAEKNGRAGDLQKELEDLFNSQNKSPNKDATSIPATFFRVTAAVN
jgi:hypothetical protein